MLNDPRAPRLRRRQLCLWLPAVALATGCAHRVSSENGEPRWSGRLALRVEGSDQQSFSSAFELWGSAARGELRLFTPLGSTAAQIRWSAEGAWIKTEGDARRFDTLDQLMQQAAGAELPVTTLFDWLGGRNTALPGWQADLGGLADGRLLAVRSAPLPTLRLRVLIDRAASGATVP